MKISLNSIRDFTKRYKCADDIVTGGTEALIEKIGAQLGAVEEVSDFGSKYQGAVIVKVVECRKHENSDHLNVCVIDDGGSVPDINRLENGLVQVVCGAPNVRAGMLAVWLPPGATVPESVSTDPFVLEAREIRGEVSNGMLASQRELALGENHDGILEIADDDAVPGTAFADRYNLRGDVVIDIENKMFTHRPDCFGLLGIARELAGIQGLPFKSPDWYTLQPAFPAIEAEPLPLRVENELPQLVPRFTAITLRDVQVGPSPLWLQIELAKVGLRSINNIVDYTNFFMLETGQPLHAYDYDKVKTLSGDAGPVLVVRDPRANEKITLLNGKTVDPRQEAIMIATDKQLIGIGGVMGGAETEVGDTTTNIILECATFDMYSIRRTSMAHGLFTDAVTRFNKGQSPLQNAAVVAKVVDEIRRFAGGKVAGELIDSNALPEAVRERGSLYPPIPITVQFINDRLGLQLTAEQVQNLLENVECRVESEQDQLHITAPFWRTDVETREDVVEEVGRLYGFDKLLLELPERSIAPVQKDAALTLKATIGATLAKAGANEVLTYSFVHGDLLDKVGQDKSQAFRLSNALSPDLQYYRLSLTPSLLEKVHANIKAGYNAFALFELGKAHIVAQVDESDLPREFDRLGLVYAAKSASGPAYYQARMYLLNVLHEFGLHQKAVFVPLDPADTDVATTYYEPSRAATVTVDGQIIGRIGEYKTSVVRALKLPEYCAGFEISIEQLLQLKTDKSYRALPRFPKVTQDITLKVPAALNYRQVYDCLQGELDKIRPAQTTATLSPLDIYQKPDDPEHKQLTFRLQIASYTKTMTDAEVARLLDAVADSAKQALRAERV